MKLKKTLLLGLIILISNYPIYSQTIQKIGKSDSTILLLNEISYGVGPTGFSSYASAPISDQDSVGKLALPKVKNIPDTLKDLKQYCIIVNKFQFYYQNYCKGLFSKEYFLKTAKESLWNLGDTIYLSKSDVKTTVSVVIGYNPQKVATYVVDANNNNDFADDSVRVLYSGLYYQSDILLNSYSVDIEYFNGKEIKKEKIRFLAQSHSKEEMRFAYSFPQFRYGKFEYEKKGYVVCAESYNPYQSIYIFPDKPTFCPPGAEFEFKPSKFIKLGDDYFQYSTCSQNLEKIKLKKVQISNSEYSKQSADNQSKHNLIPVSNQIGMTAPQIQGKDILNDSDISLTKLKGKYVFIDFWATYCGPCIGEFPNLIKAYKTFSRDEFEIVGVVYDALTKGKINQFLKDKNVIWPTISANLPTTNMKGYEINSYPTSYLLAPDGTIIAANLRGDDLMTKLELLKIKKN